jgi:hypothetical protein
MISSAHYMLLLSAIDEVHSATVHTDEKSRNNRFLFLLVLLNDTPSPVTRELTVALITALTCMPSSLDIRCGIRAEFEEIKIQRLFGEILVEGPSAFLVSQIRIYQDCENEDERTRAIRFAGVESQSWTALSVIPPNPVHNFTNFLRSENGLAGSSDEVSSSIVKLLQELLLLLRWKYPVVRHKFLVKFYLQIFRDFFRLLFFSNPKAPFVIKC